MTDTRDEEGRFLPGVSGNPAGRPVGRRQRLDVLKQELEIAVRENVRAPRIVRIVNKMCDLAEGGDVRAAKLILGIAVSSPAVQKDSGSDTPGIRIVIENATFAAGAAKQPTPIEGHVIEENKMAGIETGKSGQQSREQDTSGGNVVGKAPSNNTLHQPPNFMGESGKPDNRPTDRGDGMGKR